MEILALLADTALETHIKAKKLSNVSTKIIASKSTITDASGITSQNVHVFGNGAVSGGGHVELADSYDIVGGKTVGSIHLDANDLTAETTLEDSRLVDHVELLPDLGQRRRLGVFRLRPDHRMDSACAWNGRVDRRGRLPRVRVLSLFGRGRPGGTGTPLRARLHEHRGMGAGGLARPLLDARTHGAGRQSYDAEKTEKAWTLPCLYVYPEEFQLSRPTISKSGQTRGERRSARPRRSSEPCQACRARFSTSFTPRKITYSRP